jgi:hypothetical protein
MKYFLKHDVFGEKEVTREEWIKAERAAGFRPKCASTDPRYWTEPATGGWSSGNTSGSIIYEQSDYKKSGLTEHEIDKLRTFPKNFQMKDFEGLETGLV